MYWKCIEWALGKCFKVLLTLLNSFEFLWIPLNSFEFPFEFLIASRPWATSSIFLVAVARPSLASALQRPSVSTTTSQCRGGGWNSWACRIWRQCFVTSVLGGFPKGLRAGVSGAQLRMPLVLPVVQAAVGLRFCCAWDATAKLLGCVHSGRPRRPLRLCQTTFTAFFAGASEVLCQSWRRKLLCYLESSVLSLQTESVGTYIYLCVATRSEPWGHGVYARLKAAHAWDTMHRSHVAVPEEFHAKRA